MSKKKQTSPSAIVWFEIPATDIDRAKNFYSGLFGWKIEQFPNVPDYFKIETGSNNGSPNGGMLTRKHPAHTITNYVSVASLNRAVTKLKKLGGRICMPRTAVPEMGYFAICQDTEGNTFALWEVNDKAK
jgi:predicted enzyme related to lactoylglutathione lyase